ncbi:cobalamin-independent methionine synthase catalytic subunit [Streptomyces capillispiralis]|uniref:Cobalamin-independent methionine synthase catalytic subunit n=1 Tax=Streptomyces capillispiralis TaxID=68182 RepID=A0A561T939_9ACTN|nr:cobalamin-independent methionine synthase catalytic subunit [Streptomyces capillispiralis]
MYAERATAQRAHLGLILLPTTSIGSLPQTGELRTARADPRSGRIDTAGYEERSRAEIQEALSSASIPSRDAVPVVSPSPGCGGPSRADESDGPVRRHGRTPPR